MRRHLFAENGKGLEGLEFATTEDCNDQVTDYV